MGQAAASVQTNQVIIEGDVSIATIDEESTLSNSFCILGKSVGFSRFVPDLAVLPDLAAHAVVAVKRLTQ